MFTKLFLYIILFFNLFNYCDTNNITVSYCILTHNETDTLNKLLKFLVKHKDPIDEIIIVDDFSTNQDTIKILNKFSKRPDIKISQHSLNHNFSQQRNYAKKLCNGDFIFTIDADEIPSLFLLKNIRKILSSKADGYLIPRIHLVKNLPKDFPMTPNERGWLAWPDYQLRIFKNDPLIFWINPVHEQIINAKKIEQIPSGSQSNLDLIEKFALTEKKDFKIWENAHRFYLNCYKQWIISCIQNKNFEKVTDILKVNPHGHLSFFLDEDMKSVVNQYEKINSLVKSILIKAQITDHDINNVITYLK